MARSVPRKRLRVAIYTPGDDAGGAKKIIINTHRGLSLKHELEISLDVTLSVSPEMNQGTLTIFQLPESGRNELTGVIHKVIDYTNTSIGIGEFGQELTDLGIGKITGSDLFPDGKCRTETIRNGHAYVEIDAGYDEDVGRIFEGSSSSAHSGRQGTDWVTTLNIADGLSTIVGNQARDSFGPGTSMYTVLRSLVLTMGLGLGNLTQGTVAEAFQANGDSVFPNGFRTRGDAQLIMNRLVRLSGGEWFVDRGLFYLVRKGEALPTPPLELSNSTGIINRPQQQEGGGILLEHKFNREIRPGRPVTISSVHSSGTYRVEYVRHILNNRLGIWRSLMSLRSPSFIERLTG